MTAVEDELGILRVLGAYCQLCDDGEFEQLAQLFAPDGTFVFGDDAVTGREGLADWLEQTHPPHRRGKHLSFNAITEVAGDRASVVSDYVHLRLIGGAITPAVAGRYRDTFVRVDGRWLIARREATIEMLTESRRG